MALKKTQSQLKKEFRAIISEMRLAVRLKCADCFGYFADPYEPCTDKLCPLRKFYPTRGIIANNKTFRKEMFKLAKARDNDPSFISGLEKSEAK